MWQPDGWGWRARIGVLTPAGDLGPESEFRAMAPVGVSIHAARVPFPARAPGSAPTDPILMDPARAFVDPPHIDDAARLLGSAPLHAIALGFTSNSYLRGVEDDAALKARLEACARGIPVVLTATAARLALRALGVGRMALIDPPWFPDELTQAGAGYFAAQGLEVVYAAPAGLPSGQYLIHPGSLYEWVRRNVPTTAEAVFIGGNGFRAVGAIQALEEDMGRPVLTANQVALWQALHVAGTRAPVTNYGTIFSRPVPQ